MVTVRITTADGGQVRSAGVLAWDGQRLSVTPSREEDRPMLMRILNRPIMGACLGDPVPITKATPELFLRTLCQEYTGSYLRASKPE